MSGYRQILVIGYGVVTGKVLAFVNELSEKYSYTVCYIEHEKHPFNGAKKYAENTGIKYYLIEDKKELTSFFEKIARNEKTLIISASNNYLFPKSLIEKGNITIMNFHSALLPDLPGRNAASWAIYKRYKKTGITWHFVTAGIDDGDIIIQKEFDINNDIKAYELVSIQMELAATAFKECFEQILNHSVKATKQRIERGSERKIYKSKEIPGDGRFDITDDSRNIYRLLRAMDYGKNDIFPLPKTIYDGKEVYVKRYKIVNSYDKKEDNSRVYLPYDDDRWLMLKFVKN